MSLGKSVRHPTETDAAAVVPPGSVEATLNYLAPARESIEVRALVFFAPEDQTNATTIDESVRISS